MWGGSEVKKDRTFLTPNTRKFVKRAGPEDTLSPVRTKAGRRRDRYYIVAIGGIRISGQKLFLIRRGMEASTALKKQADAAKWTLRSEVTVGIPSAASLPYKKGANKIPSGPGAI